MLVPEVDGAVAGISRQRTEEEEEARTATLRPRSKRCHLPDC